LVYLHKCTSGSVHFFLLLFFRSFYSFRYLGWGINPGIRNLGRPGSGIVCDI
jgi:hypothetical protein